MPRKLHPNGVPEFLSHYEVAETCEACGTPELTVAVYDHYGTTPADGSPDSEGGVGTFVSALVICEACGHSLTLNRARLAAKQAAQ